MKCESCDITMIQKDFKLYSVFYCPACFDYKQTELVCEHDYMLMLFELSNGALQLRNYCKKCHHRPMDILTQKGVDTRNIPIKQETKYKKFINEIYDPENDERIDFLGKLRENQHQQFHKVYYDYINSDEWKAKREIIKKRDNNTCGICGNKGNEVHHLTYAHFMNEYDFELILLCEYCHTQEYHSDKARKRVSALNIPVHKK